MEYFLIIISAIFVNNIMLAQFLGTCPFLGVSNKISTATGMAGAVCFVITLATLVTYLINQYLLVAFNLQFLQTIAFILVIAALVQMVEIVLKKISPSLYQALGIFLPLITTNCAVLGVPLLNIANGYNFLESLVFGASSAIGFSLVLVLFAGIRERVEGADVPVHFRGVAIAMVTAGLMSLAFMGFAGLDKYQ